MNKAIIYFTQKAKLGSLQLGASTKKLQPYLTNDEVKVIGYPCELPLIYLVFDNLELEEFKIEIWSKIYPIFDEFAFVYHKLPNKKIIDFLHKKTDLSLEGSHQKNIPGYEYYEPLKGIISTGNVSDDLFDKLWSQFKQAADSEERLNEQHKKFLESITFFEDERIKENIIYIDNIQDDTKEKIESYGIIVLSPKEIIDNIPDDESSLIVLCEVDMNEKGESIKRTDFYGTKLAQELRRKGFKGRILFVSFMEESFFLQNQVRFKLIAVKRGHSFLELTNKNSDLTNLIEEVLRIVSLDDLSLRDIQWFSVGIAGIIEERLHVITEATEYHNELETLLIQVYSHYDEAISKVLDEFEKIIKYKEAYTFTESKLTEIIKKYDDENPRGKLSKKYNWSILWLDDEVKRVYEKGGTKLVVERISSDYEIEIIKAGTYVEAVDIWHEDRATTRSITVVIVDYRLTTKTENGYIQNINQGYHFLEEIVKEESTLALFVYSGMPRIFLSKTFSYYGKNIRFYSKIRLPLNKVNSYNFICEEIAEEGDRAWIGINNQPQSKAWMKNDGNNPAGLPMNEVFYKFKNEVGFNSWNRNCNVRTERNILQFDNEEVSEFNIKASDFTSSPGRQIPKLKDILVARRFAVTILARNFVEHFDTDKLRGIKKTIGLYIHKCSGNNKIREKTHHDIFNRIAIDVTNFPLFLLPEEYAWIKYECEIDLKFNKLFDNYFETIKLIKTTFEKVFGQFNSGFLQSLLDTDGFYKIEQKHVGTSEFSHCFDRDDEIKQYYFDSSYRPIVRTSMDLKIIIYFIKFHTKSSSREEYKAQLLEFSTLLTELKAVLKRKNKMDGGAPKSLMTLIQFIDGLPAKTKGQFQKDRYDSKTKKFIPIKKKESIIHEYKRLYVPWEFALPKRKYFSTDEEFYKACDKRKKNIIHACKNYVKISDTWEGYSYISNKFSKVNEDEILTYEAKVTKAIYEGIFNYKKDKNKRIKARKCETDIAPIEYLLSDTCDDDIINKIREPDSDNFILKFNNIKDESKDNLTSKFHSLMEIIGFEPSSETEARLAHKEEILKNKLNIIDNSDITSDYLVFMSDIEEEDLNDDVINKINEYNLIKSKLGLYIFNLTNFDHA